MSVVGNCETFPKALLANMSAENLMFDIFHNTMYIQSKSLQDPKTIRLTSKIRITGRLSRS